MSHISCQFSLISHNKHPRLFYVCDPAPVMPKQAAKISDFVIHDLQKMLKISNVFVFLFYFKPIFSFMLTVLLFNWFSNETCMFSLTIVICTDFIYTPSTPRTSKCASICYVIQPNFTTRQIASLVSSPRPKLEANLWAQSEAERGGEGVGGLLRPPANNHTLLPSA